MLAGAGVLYVRLSRQGAASSLRPLPPPVFSGNEVVLSGRIQALEVVPVAVPIDGTIQAMAADVGQEVFEGQLLAQIKSTGAESNRQSVKADMDKLRARIDALHSQLIPARAEASRSRQLALQAQTTVQNLSKEVQKLQIQVEAGAEKRQRLEKAEAQYEAAKSAYDTYNTAASSADQKVSDLLADLDVQNKALEEMTRAEEDVSVQVASGDVMSPADGYVIARHGQVGDEVTRDSPELFQIGTDLAVLRLVVPVPSELRPKIQAGEPVVIQIAEIPEAIEAKVDEVRDGELWIQFSRPSRLVNPGMTAAVRIKLG